MRKSYTEPRYRSPQDLLLEMQKMRPQWDCFRFNDDHFTGNPRLGELLVEIGNLGVTFRAFARIEDLTADTCKALKAAGCLHISVGLESLNNDNLRMLGKTAQIGHEGNLRIATEAGLTVRAYFIVGLPHDSDDVIKRTADRAAAIGGIDEFVIYPLIPYPGTLIAQHPEHFGYRIVNQDFTSYVQIGRENNAGFALQHERFGPDDVRRWRNLLSDRLQKAGIITCAQGEIAQ